MTSFRVSPQKVSPNSSRDGGESFEGTPDTKITAFSPEDVRSMKLSAVQSSGTPFRGAHHDPFITSAPKPKLDATVPSFQPYGLRVAPIPSARLAGPIPGTFQYLDDVVEKATSTPPRAEATHFGVFTTNSNISRCMKLSSDYPASIPDQLDASKAMIRRRGYTMKGTERIDIDTEGSIYLRYSHVGDAVEVYNGVKGDHTHLKLEYISSGECAEVMSPRSKGKWSAHEGQVAVRAAYPTATPTAKKEFEEHVRTLLTCAGTLCAWQKIVAGEAGVFEMIVEFHDSSAVPHAIAQFHGGQVCNGHSLSMLSVMAHQPDLAAIATHRPIQVTTPTRRSAFDQSGLSEAMGGMSFDIAETPPAAGRFGGAHLQSTSAVRIGQALRHVSPNRPYMQEQMPTTNSYMTGNQPVFGPPRAGIPVIMNGMYQQLPVMATYDHQNNQLVPQNFQNITQFHQQDTGHYSNQFYAEHPRDMSLMNRPRRQVGARIPSHVGIRRPQTNPAGNHNHVDIDRIRHGIDVRTTVMLRNIPNKVDQAMLKSIIDESSFGRYDFMYLRIDFSNNCNVGYAFINFQDPFDIIDFVRARSNQRWLRFKSDKVAEVSYATIQGRDCLIQKFRNSSVMLEAAHYRPKLFFTVSDQHGRVGEEDVFPASDNASKLKRSCENAEHVGLFAPSAGQHLRDEQRRRRSQYDRGTSLAKRDEGEYDDDDFPSQSFPPGPYHY